jgi:alkanesulfonate monooxygenase SsuD/methylene tetrahydromethanopterin reductase-like flavin-dependent oxidoreductase (luciferase family)
MVQLSVWPNAQQPWADLLEVTQHADRTGWHGVYVWDHFMGDDGGFGAADVPTLEVTGVLSALGGLTEHLRVAPLVLGNTYRHPAVVANWVATLDHITGGRAALGIGAGWQVNEHEQYGIELPPPGERIERLEEAVEVIRGLLGEPRTTMQGDHYRVTEALNEPKPVQERLPILIGGKGDRMLRLVARQADEWNMWSLPEQIAERMAVLDRACERIERDPAEIRRSTQALVMVTDDEAKAAAFLERVAPRVAIAGPPERFAEVVGEWAALGVDEVIVPDVALGRGAERQDRLDALKAAVDAT